MKRKTAAALTGILSLVFLMSGCEAAKGLETDEITITQYKEVQVEQVDEPEEVTDEEVETQIETTLKSTDSDGNYTYLTEVTDRGAEEGDIVEIGYVGKMDGEEFDGGTSDKDTLELGNSSYIEGFAESIVGHKAGDTYEWNGAFPDDYSSTDLAGKDVTFEITLQRILEVPELTDDLAAQLSEDAKTADEYKAEVKEQLETEAQETYDSTLADEVWSKILENTTVNEYPDGEVEELTNTYIEQYKSYAESVGMEYEDFMESYMGMSVESFETQVTESAQDEIKSRMAAEAIAEAEGIELSDDAYEEYLTELAGEYGYEDADALKEAVSDEDTLKSMALKDLVLDQLVDSCIQVAE